jgi:branched-chain amino acid transport system ATP-binding protein
VIDAYLGAHHDAALTFEEEEKILAEAEAELAAELEERLEGDHKGEGENDE